MSHIKIGSTCIALTLGIASHTAHAAVVEVSQALGKAGTNSDIGYPTIVVDGAGTSSYDHVVTKNIDAWVRVKGGAPKNGRNPSGATLKVEGRQISIDVPAANKIYKINFPYVAPLSAAVANDRVSPVKLCNDEIQKRQGADRAAYLEDGGSVLRKNAYRARASVTWSIRDTKGVFKDPDALKPYSDEVLLGVNIECRPLDRPKVRTSKSAGGKSEIPGKRGPKAKKADPTIKSATLRIEPANMKRFGNDMCPAQLQLYGQVATIRTFRGAAIFLGSGFLSPITSLDFPAAGTQTVRGTYPLKWNDGPSGTLAMAGKTAPKAQTVTLRMNIATQDKKVIETATETVKVTCERVQPVRTGAREPQRVTDPPRRVASGNTASGQDFDARIRRVDRQGPAGTVQLWAYNAGPGSAAGCSIAMRTGPGDDYQQVATVATIGAGQTLTIGAGQTTTVSDALPAGPGSEFRIDCPNEPESAKANNGYLLDE